MRELYGGLQRAANRFKVSIVGGETSSTPGPIAISVSVIGFVERIPRGHRAVAEDRVMTFSLPAGSEAR